MSVVVLVVCLLALLVKLPRAIRGYGRPSSIAIALLALGTFLAQPNVYMLIDGWLGGHNILNLVIRLTVFGVASAMALSLSRIFKAYRVEAFVTGYRGIIVVALSMIALTVILAVSGAMNGSSPGLASLNTLPIAYAYQFVGLAYPAALTGVLFFPTVRFIVVSKGAIVARIAYTLMAVGMGLITIGAAFAFFQSIGFLELRQPYFVTGWIPQALFAAGVLLHATWAWVERRKLAQSHPEVTKAYPAETTSPSNDPANT